MARLTDRELSVAAELLECDTQDVRTVLSKWWYNGQKDRATSLAETARTLALADRVIAEAAPLMTNAATHAVLTRQRLSTACMGKIAE